LQKQVEVANRELKNSRNRLKTDNSASLQREAVADRELSLAIREKLDRTLTELTTLKGEPKVESGSSAPSVTPKHKKRKEKQVEAKVAEAEEEAQQPEESTKAQEANEEAEAVKHQAGEPEQAAEEEEQGDEQETNEEVQDGDEQAEAGDREAGEPEEDFSSEASPLVLEQATSEADTVSTAASPPPSQSASLPAKALKSGGKQMKEATPSSSSPNRRDLKQAKAKSKGKLTPVAAKKASANRCSAVMKAVNSPEAVIWAFGAVLVMQACLLASWYAS